MRTMKLRTRLAPAEIDSKREAIVELLSERTEVAEAKKAAAARFRESLKDLDSRIEALRAEAAEGYDLREVEVDEQITDGVVRIFRIDTGETISERKMTRSEREARIGAAGRHADAPEATEGDDSPGDDEEPAGAARTARRGRRPRAQSGRAQAASDPWGDLDARAAEEAGE